MHITQVIKQPVLTEKTYALMQDNSYTFLVDVNANKHQIKYAFETIFENKVESVKIINLKPRPKRVGRYTGETARAKKAIIKLCPGEKFDLFNEQK